MTVSFKDDPRAWKREYMREYRKRPQFRAWFRCYEARNRAKLNSRMCEWRRKNPTKAKEIKTRSNERNREMIRERDKIRRNKPDTKERRAASNRRWRSKNEEYLKQKNRQWRASNKSRARASAKQWRKSERGKAIIANSGHLRRARLQIEKPPSHAEILSLLKSTSRCLYCGKKFTLRRIKTLDHVLPLARGGKHVLSNLVVCCLICNCSKNASHPNDFAKKLGRLFI